MPTANKQESDFLEFLSTIWEMDLKALRNLHEVHTRKGGLFQKAEGFDEMMTYARRIGAIEAVMYSLENKQLVR